VGVAIQLTLPPQPVRAAWWQPTLLIHVAWVQRVRNVKQGADYECDSCFLPEVSVWEWICAGCGLGKLYSVVVCGVPSKVHTVQLLKIQPDERLATTSELNPTSSLVTG